MILQRLQSTADYAARRGEEAVALGRAIDEGVKKLNQTVYGTEEDRVPSLVFRMRQAEEDLDNLVIARSEAKAIASAKRWLITTSVATLSMVATLMILVVRLWVD